LAIIKWPEAEAGFVHAVAVLRYGAVVQPNSSKDKRERKAGFMCVSRGVAGQKSGGGLKMPT
jgi:hypothetical protein